jgi:hypothetical protein
MSGLLTVDVGIVTAFCWGEIGCERPAWSHHIFTSRYEPELSWEFAKLMVDLVRPSGKIPGRPPIGFRPGFLGIELPWIPRDASRLSSSTMRIIYMSRAAEAIAYGHGLKVRSWSIQQVAGFIGAPDRPSAKKKAVTKQIIGERYGWAPLAEGFDESDTCAVWLKAEADLDPASSAARPLGELFTAKAMAKKPARKREPKQATLGL